MGKLLALHKVPLTTFLPEKSHKIKDNANSKLQQKIMAGRLQRNKRHLFPNPLLLLQPHCSLWGGGPSHSLAFSHILELTWTPLIGSTSCLCARQLHVLRASVCPQLHCFDVIFSGCFRHTSTIQANTVAEPSIIQATTVAHSFIVIMLYTVTQQNLSLKKKNLTQPSPHPAYYTVHTIFFWIAFRLRHVLYNNTTLQFLLKSWIGDGVITAVSVVLTQTTFDSCMTTTPHDSWTTLSRYADSLTAADWHCLMNSGTRTLKWRGTKSHGRYNLIQPADIALQHNWALILLIEEIPHHWLI